MKNQPNELSLGIQDLEALDAPADGKIARAFLAGLAVGLAIVAAVVT